MGIMEVEMIAEWLSPISDKIVRLLTDHGIGLFYLLFLMFSLKVGHIYFYATSKKGRIKN